MEFVELLNLINLQEEVSLKVINLFNKNSDIYKDYIDNLININTSLETFVFLEEKYKEDKDNLNILCIYLLAALKTYQRYQEKGISDIIFIDTMKCFTRFIDECYLKNNKYFFDRGFWTYRQVNMSLYRIGVLEYEFMNDNTISIHIPSDAILTKENIDLSFKLLDEFIIKFYPEFIDKKIYCDTWLLSPNLREYLNDNSRILIFQSYFEISETDLDSLDIFEWVFKVDKSCEIVNLPTTTSLQEKLKKALLNNKKIGKALGILKKK